MVRHFIIGYVCTNKKNNEKDFLSDHLLAFLLPDFRAFFVGDELPSSSVDFFFEDLDCGCSSSVSVF